MATQLSNPFVASMQLSARALTGDHKLKVRWVVLPKGAGAMFNFSDNTIYMPKVNTALLTPIEMAKLRALSYHERLHHALTDGKQVEKTISDENKDGVIWSLFQVIEDCRIEMNDHYRLPGDLEDLLVYRRRIFVPKVKEDLGPFGFFLNPWGALCMAIKITLPKYGELPLPAPLQPYYDDAMNILGDGRFSHSCKKKQEGSKMTLILAKEIFEAWKNRAQSDENFQEPGEGVPKITEDAKKEQSENGMGGSTSLPNMKGNQSRSSQGEGSQGEGSEGEGSESEGSEGEGSEDEEPQAGEEGHGAENNVDNDTNIDIDKQFKNAQKDKDGWKFDNDSLNKEVGALSDPEKAAERAEKLEKETKGKFGESEDLENQYSDSVRAPRRHTRTKKKYRGDEVTYVPFNVYDRTVIANPYPEEAQKIKDHIGPSITRTRAELMKVLIGLSQSRKQSCLKRGKLDQRMLHKIPKHDHRVFFRVREAQKLTCAIQIVVDLSSSMQSGHPYSRGEVAAQACMLLGESLSTLAIPFEIIGFNTSPAGSYGWNSSGKHRDEADEARASGMDRTLDLVNRWVFKAFSENYRSCFPRLGAMNIGMSDYDGNLNAGAVGGCNVDHEVILWGAGRLWNQTAKRKIQIVLSDGQPSGYGGDYDGLLDRMLVLANRKIIASGIEQYCFSIQSNCCKHYYSHWKIINNIEDLNSQALKFLASAANIKGSAHF